MEISQSELQFIKMLSERLERISADSVWAHRASGVRGSLLHLLDQGDILGPTDPVTVSNAIATALHILSQAAKRS